MQNRRSVLKILGALGLSLLLPIGRAFGYCLGTRVIVNGVALELPKQLNIRIEVEPGGAAMDFVRMEIVGGTLTISNKQGPGIEIVAKQGGYVVVEGTDGVCITNENPSPPGYKMFDADGNYWQPDAAITINAINTPGIVVSDPSYYGSFLHTD